MSVKRNAPTGRFNPRIFRAFLAVSCRGNCCCSQPIEHSRTHLQSAPVCKHRVPLLLLQLQVLFGDSQLTWVLCDTSLLNPSLDETGWNREKGERFAAHTFASELF